MESDTTVSRLLLRISAALLIAAFVLAWCGAVYQKIGTWTDARSFPQRGRSFQAGAVRLNLNCTGQGDVTVILDSGLGGSVMDWMQVQPEVAKFTRVCSYDRAGYGWSESSPEPRTSLQIARELKTLLTVAGEGGPYVLVGHSFGGYNVRVFTGLYPIDVAGVVLVDASHPDEEKRTREILSPAQAADQKSAEQRHEQWERMTAPISLHLGIDRFAVAMGLSHSPYRSKELQKEILYLEQQPEFLNTVQAEERFFATSGGQAVSAGDLGDRPLIVLTAGRPYEPDSLLTAEQMKKQSDIWIHVLQVEQMHLSSRGKQIVVPDSGHDIPLERPAAVISAIQSVWNDVK